VLQTVGGLIANAKTVLEYLNDVKDASQERAKLLLDVDSVAVRNPRPSRGLERHPRCTRCAGRSLRTVSTGTIPYAKETQSSSR